ncbi:type I restriction endonuclease subunit S, partial [Lactobacillus delbrueckii subsp. bulgaricus]|nr:type I restriction endonuclease subunit S [Lactobacillus delbrueckii subsp. bulgaricus]
MGDLADRVTTKNKGMVSELPLTISAQDGLISQDEFFNKKVASKDLSSYLLLHHGDFAYNKSYSNGYPFGTIKRLEKYPQGVVSSLYIAFKPNSSISSDFMAQYYESNNWHKEIYKCAAEGARNHGLLNVPPSDFFATNLNIPITKSEQLKIGRLLNAVDQTITLHEEKKRQLERLKSALMQKMFADKSGYPPVRFEGFSNEWEHCKLGDVFVERNQKTVADKNYPLCSFIAHKGVVPKAKYDRSFLVKSDDKKYKRTELNDFIYSSNNLETGSIGLNKFGNATISPVYS